VIIKLSEKWPSSSALRSVGLLWVAISVILALVWSYFSSEWWSVCPGVLAVFFFVEGIAHMNVYAIMADTMQTTEERDVAKSAK
jgi:hypothetical protein